MIIFDRNSKSLDIPVGLGNLEVNIISGGTGGGVTSINGQTGNVSLKTINGNDVVGEGNIEIQGGGVTSGEVQTMIESALTDYATTADTQSEISSALTDYSTTADTKNAIESALTEAKGYTDTQIEGLNIPNTYVLNLMTNEELGALLEELSQYSISGQSAPSSGFPAASYNFYVYFNSGQDNGGGFVPMRLSRLGANIAKFEGLLSGYVGRNFKTITFEIADAQGHNTLRENWCSVFSLNGQKGELKLKTINNESILGEGNIEIQGGGATTGEVQTMIDTAIGAETARTENTYLKQVDLNGYATKNWVEGKGYVTSADTADFVTSAQTKTQIEGYHYTTSADTAQAISSSLTEYYTSGQTDEKIQDAVSGIDLSDYYTSAQTDNKISSALTDYYTSGQTDSAITTATQNMVTSTAVNNIWVGTTAQYNAITTKDPNTLYFINNN